MDNTKTPTQKGVRTFIQTLGGLLVGLLIAVWNVPGVPEAIVAYVQANFVPLFAGLLVTVGLPSGLIAYFQNKKGL